MHREPSASLLHTAAPGQLLLPARLLAAPALRNFDKTLSSKILTVATDRIYCGKLHCTAARGLQHPAGTPPLHLSCRERSVRGAGGVARSCPSGEGWAAPLPRRRSRGAPQHPSFPPSLPPRGWGAERGGRGAGAGGGGRWARRGGAGSGRGAPAGGSALPDGATAPGRGRGWGRDPRRARTPSRPLPLLRRPGLRPPPATPFSAPEPSGLPPRSPRA